MSNYLAVLNVNKNAQDQWLRKLSNVTKSGHHIYAHFTTVIIGTDIYQTVIDGELYNETELKASLRHKGLEKDIASIEELIVYAYRAWGHGMMNHMLGAFTFVIDDGKEVFIAKDQMGLRPLFYAQKKGTGIIVASKIKDILATKIIKPIVDRKGVRELLALGPSISENMTLYKGIQALPMGHYMIIKKNSIQIKKYYEPVAKPHFDSYEDTAANVKYLVEDAIKRQSKGCDATFLSGGLDSSIIAACMAKQGELFTYSLDYEGNDENFKGNLYQVSLDTEYINRMVEMTRSTHTKLTITQEELRDELVPALSARDLPGMADVDSALLWLCKQVKKDRSVIMSGECSDEVFGGYPWFYREELAHLDTFPWLRSVDQRKSLFNESLKSMDIDSYIHKRYKETLADITYLDSDSEADQRARIHTILCLHWFMQTLVTRQVCMGEDADVVIRAPFADIRILDYVYNIPWDMKFLDQEEKGILRKAFEDELPEEVAHRKKNPFPKTHNPKYCELMKEKLQECYDNPNSVLHILFDDEALKDLIETGGAAFPLPWYGQLMNGPQLLAYLYQIDQWFQTIKPTLRLS